jgi:hypothetical protein
VDIIWCINHGNLAVIVYLPAGYEQVFSFCADRCFFVGAGIGSRVSGVSQR